MRQISSHGDTLLYNVAAFRSASDRNIEDVIRKLPGISVSENGTISYQGESINKFYIEGLDLLSGRYALATRNISPDDIASVSIYENHQPKKVLKDISFSEKAALNLKLKNQPHAQNLRERLRPELAMATTCCGKVNSMA